MRTKEQQKQMYKTYIETRNTFIFSCLVENNLLDEWKKEQETGKKNIYCFFKKMCKENRIPFEDKMALCGFFFLHEENKI